MIKVFSPTDTNFDSNGDIIIIPLSAVVHHEMDGDYYLDLTADLKYESWLERGNILVAPTPQGYQAFRVNNPTKTNESIETQAKHVYFDSENYLSLAHKIKNKTGSQAIATINSGVVPSSPFTVSADDTKQRSKTFEASSLCEAFEEFRSKWAEHLIRDNFNVQFVKLSEMGADRQLTIEYAKNLVGITCEENWDEVCTTIMPMGKDNIMLNSLDSSVSAFLNADVQYATPYVRMVQFQQDGIEQSDYQSKTAYKQALIADLREQAEDYLDEYKYPKINYAIEAYVDSVVDIGDTIEVKDQRLGITLMTRVIAYDYNCVSGIYDSIEFGNFTERLSNLLPTINKKVDKQVGMGLSENNFTTEDLDKLDGIEEGATKVDISNISSDDTGVVTIGNVMIQWGIVTASGSGNISFSYLYSVAPSVMLTAGDTNNNCIAVTNVTNSGCAINAIGTNRKVRWLAIGKA